LNAIRQGDFENKMPNPPQAQKQYTVHMPTPAVASSSKPLMITAGDDEPMSIDEKRADKRKALEAKRQEKTQKKSPPTSAKQNKLVVRDIAQDAESARQAAFEQRVLETLRNAPSAQPDFSTERPPQLTLPAPGDENPASLTKKEKAELKKKQAAARRLEKRNAVIQKVNRREEASALKSKLAKTIIPQPSSSNLTPSEIRQARANRSTTTGEQLLLTNEGSSQQKNGGREGVNARGELNHEKGLESLARNRAGESRMTSDAINSVISGPRRYNIMLGNLDSLSQTPYSMLQLRQIKHAINTFKPETLVGYSKAANSRMNLAVKKIDKEIALRVAENDRRKTLQLEAGEGSSRQRSNPIYEID
jgi:hypothetical protein